MGQPLTVEEKKAIEKLDTVVREGTFYELLGIEVAADVKAIQAAYYDLSRKWHPDRFFRRDESYRTISAELGLPAGTIASRIARCLRRLREELEGRSGPARESGG